jgi:hypothetical protein
MVSRNLSQDSPASAGFFFINTQSIAELHTALMEIFYASPFE